MTDALQDYLDSVRAAPFRWGEHDCALFAAKGVDALHGTSFADAVRAYGVKSARDYRRLQRKGRTLEAMTTNVVGEPITGEPQRGDVGGVRTVRGTVLGLCAPPVVLCAGEAGIEAMPISAVHVAWRPSCRR